MSASILLDSGASHNFIAAPQLIKSSKSVQKLLLCPVVSKNAQLANNSSVVSHQIVYLLFIFAYSAYYAVELRVVLVLNHAKILGIAFLHTFNPSIDC